jgi:hypothetical protein
MEYFEILMKMEETIEGKSSIEKNDANLMNEEKC